MLRSTRMPATAPKKAIDSVAERARLFIAMAFLSLPTTVFEGTEYEPECQRHDRDEEEHVARVDDAELHAVGVVAEGERFEPGGGPFGQEVGELAGQAEE